VQCLNADLNQRDFGQLLLLAAGTSRQIQLSLKLALLIVA